MNIRSAVKSDIENISNYDKHISKRELDSIVSLNRVIIAEDRGKFIGWL